MERLKKSFALIVTVLMAVLVMAACGNKSQSDVVKGLDKKVESLNGYKAEAKMTLQTGSEPQVYNVEIWHKQPSYYRVSLKSADKEQSQMILRNDEGVYVLTPALNKSFRFQSDWPKNSSQAYLFESLVKDVMDDKKPVFKSTDSHYVFETKTNYQNNKMLPFQEISFNKNDLSPSVVKVMDQDRNPLVTVEFTKFQFNSSFDKDSFDMHKNMSFALLDVPANASANAEPFAVKYPLSLPDKVSLKTQKEIKTENGKRVIMTFGGKKAFTMIQEPAAVSPPSDAATPVSGTPADLGFTVGSLTKKSISWTNNRVQYMIASENLTPDELISVARSVQGQSAK
ncbi:outer membrane lipoprotein carrier protein LolA [Metabacillus sp. GX 13764]|uniref:LolA family protein n=1 Tax=Metabacillus kandeliae TaxID=2900151 RepID=UPI001E30BB2E|nr:outer membrane lipoprotein carrier protein LolA [Metabacillus kandeliae]MCD7036707.1 outer membrane lipoprotein carrier protein LolA [Metabacillus kandeliae]